MSAHSVSPSALGTTSAVSIDALADRGMYELSVCQPSLPRTMCMISPSGGRISPSGVTLLIAGQLEPGLERAEPPGEGQLGVVVEVLPREDQQRVGVEGVLHDPPRGVVELGEAEPADAGAERRGQRLDGDLGRHAHRISPPRARLGPPTVGREP